MLASAFLSDGFEFCIEAENGKEGIEAARQRKIDLIILDLSMPVMNGLQAAPELRMLLPHTPIILFTLYADSLPHKDTAAAGVTIVLAKGTPLLLIVEKAHELMRN
jgi:CheY-like chemotaxis protein